MSNFFNNIDMSLKQTLETDKLQIPLSYLGSYSDFDNNNDNININNNDTNININDNNDKKNPDHNVNICVVGITNSLPYDRSVFVNNEKVFYTQIDYSQLMTLKKLINDLNNENLLEQTQSYGMNLLYILNCFKDTSIKLLFRFLCSPDCNDGEIIINDDITNEIYAFVKYVTTRNNCLIEVSDHSMYAFFKNWDNSFMEMECPIEISPILHAGPFKMYGNKNDFINSIHPTLQQIGDLSSSEQIEITFNNMGGTKTYKIKESELDRVRIISKGVQIKNQSNFMDTSINIDINFENNYYLEVPVHSEFNFNKGKIIISATHWSNLNSVETPIHIPSLTRYYTDMMGEKAGEQLQFSLFSVTNENEAKRIISNTVRQISSGTGVPQTKKAKYNIDINDKQFNSENFPYVDRDISERNIFDNTKDKNSL